MSRILLAACVLALAIRLYSQSPDCPWPGDGEPCPPGCYPAQLLGLEVVCYGIDDFHCCLEVWARYACTDKPNCLGQPYCTYPWRGRTRDSCTPASTHREGDLIWES